MKHEPEKVGGGSIGLAADKNISTDTSDASFLSPQARRRAAWNPKAVWAQFALRRGFLERRLREVFGTEKNDAHYDHYDRPMVVRFLCRACHRIVHRKKRMAAA